MAIRTPLDLYLQRRQPTWCYQLLSASSERYVLGTCDVATFTLRGLTRLNTSQLAARIFWRKT